LRDREKNTNSNQPINEQIRFPRLQLIDHEGTNIGVISRHEALQMARDAGLDLVLISDQGAEGAPVVKIMDFGKALYAKKKKMSESKKHQKLVQVKEIKIRPKIGEHDYQTKMNQAIQFLKDGKKVKVTLMFRGREMMMQQERGNELFAKVDQSFSTTGLNILHEKESRMGYMWSRIYFVKK
jgi:translation initiation factor IF-3